MKISKYTKLRSNQYEVLIDDEKIKLYDDVIVKYELLRKKDISKDEFNDIVSYNNLLEAYYKSLKYITKRMRTEREIVKYLEKSYDKDVILKTIEKLKSDGYINRDLYLRSFILDKINLGLDGPNKIKKELVKLGFYDNEFTKYINEVADEVWLSKLKKIINKKINSNHSYGNNKLKLKILYDLENQGYYKWMIEDVINSLEFRDDKEIYKKEYDKVYMKLSRKYEGEKLDYQVRQRLRQKGFSSYENGE